MRDEQSFDVYEQAEHVAPRPATRWRAALGAVVSVVVLAAVIVWAYRLGVRDAYAVPVVRAIEGPARIRPEEPGGAHFAHQGLAVYGALDPAAASSGAGATLAAAPEPLAAEDAPAATLAPGLAASRTAPPAAAAPVSPAQVAPLDAAPPPLADAQPGAAAGLATEVDQLVATVLGETAPAAPQRSAIPAPRPRGAGSAATASGTPAPEGPAAQPSADQGALAAAAPVGGGLQVQLGAYLSEADAMRMWAEIRVRNGDLLASRAPTIAPLQGVNRTLYRLRAGPLASEAEARALCAAMLARREDCLVTGVN